MHQVSIHPSPCIIEKKINRNDKYAEKLNEAYTTLKTYIDGETAPLNINKAQLNGLLGILGEDLFSQKKSLNGYDDNEQGMIVSSGELLSMDFQTIGLQGKYRDLIGDPSVGYGIAYLQQIENF